MAMCDTVKIVDKTCEAGYYIKNKADMEKGDVEYKGSDKAPAQSAPAKPGKK